MINGAAELPYGDVGTITGNENVLILAPGPGDETLACGGLIAASCRRGRPPFVMVLGDGAGSGAAELARVRGRQTREAMGCLGLEHERLLMAGLYHGTIPAAGTVFDAIVRAVSLVMWRQDCNVLCAPWPAPGRSADEQSTWCIAVGVAAESGVGLLGYAGGGTVPQAVPGWTLDVAPYLTPKQHALTAHGVSVLALATPQNEVFLRLG